MAEKPVKQITDHFEIPRALPTPDVGLSDILAPFPRHNRATTRVSSGKLQRDGEAQPSAPGELAACRSNNYPFRMFPLSVRIALIFPATSAGGSPTAKFSTRQSLGGVHAVRPTLARRLLYLMA